MTTFNNNNQDNDISMNNNESNVKYVLHIFLDPRNNHEEQYQERINSHNEKLLINRYNDSGFDLFVPEDIMLNPNQVNKIDFRIKCEMKKKKNNSYIPSAFYLYPRSSISKSKFRLANNVGIIDSGYRGNLIGMFDVIYSNEDIKCAKGTRLLQICSPTLEPFEIKLVENDNSLSTTTRNTNGFGSTGGTNE